MLLNHLIAGLPIHPHTGSLDIEIENICDDSRSTRPNSLFYARPTLGENTVNTDYIAQAIALGAVAILLPAGAIYNAPDFVSILHLDSKLSADQMIGGFLADRLLGHPAGKLKLLSVTGTNGKTTVATFCQQFLRARGEKCGLIGTIHIDTGDANGTKPSMLTTPGAIELAYLFKEMLDNGCTSCVMEASSHAIEQARVRWIPFTAAAFTNLTGDHLDYHGTFEAYRNAKASLFKNLPSDSVAIVNADSPEADEILLNCPATKVWCTTATDDTSIQNTPRPARLAATIGKEGFGTWALLALGESMHPFECLLPLTGEHNIMNALQAFELAQAACPLRSAEDAKAHFEALQAAPGRLEAVSQNWPKPYTEADNANPFVVVDYAHTHDALSHALQALRPHVAENGKLICVMGCGGDRDRNKRPLMGQAAVTYADKIWLTSDNPRTENPNAIITEITAGLPNDYDVEIKPNRAEAIAVAIAGASPNDIVLIAGKGHETYQIIGNTKHDFDDRKHAASALAKREHA